MLKPPESSVTHTAHGTTFAGPDATNLARAIHIKVALNLFARSGIIATRGANSTRLLAMATPYTGKKYKRGQHAQAAADMVVWIDTMKAALPTTTTEGAPKT